MSKFSHFERYSKSKVPGLPRYEDAIEEYADEEERYIKNIHVS
jgi:hypothetical protein